MHDFSIYKESLMELGGARSKISIIDDNDNNIMLKLQEDNTYFYISEYIAYKLANNLKIPCQEVSLGIYNGIRCSAIKLFTSMYETVHSYVEMHSSSLDSEDHASEYIEDEKQYTLLNIKHVLETYKNLSIPVKERLDAFQDMCIFDALMGNFDRHWGNWGYYGRPKNYKITPLFDNGSSLYPSRNMDETMKCLSDDKYLTSKILKYPTSPIRITINKKTNYVDLINEVVNIFGKERLLKFSQDYVKIDLDKLFDDKDLMEHISDIDVIFYKKVIQMRFDLIIRGVLNV